MSLTTVAAIDCGTNSIRLLVADADPATGQLVDRERRMEIVRLGQGVDRTGRLAPEALERTLAACRDYAEVIAAHGVTPDRLRFVATSASRDAENRADFVDGVRAILGVEPEVITGEEEAALSFTGATTELAGRPEVARPFLVMDIGGGSTEFVLGDEGVTAARSVDIGCVRLTERHLTTADGAVADPPGAEALAALTADIDAALELAAERVPLARAGTLVGLAGSVTTVAAMALGLPSYDPSAIHHTVLERDRVREIVEWLLTATHAERAAVPSMHPGRVDVIGAGALVLLRAMERADVSRVTVSEHDILDGIAFHTAREVR
ncbi:exopolyphosphatase / guanosine-5'-triphosphate,3'-diphosphate pyrophosphatase [Streptomyces zhaozhouensis]|uniref:Exopolyphosphatase / guanosine-5'-triphosphate,3'-diphosphate pyrophosphatase n=1 Tax=Streptomyces zhaozhouensis TaxID=1300267 RepID=A0A286E2X0_9ACTN|nr:exopolyphosphatase / guanosine-5'-triphosphate,3'-diphosphate pyrophosphatase [Streptomyces zhaozhouensis]